MTHEEALNYMLAHCCGRLSDEELGKNGGIQEFYLEAHCKGFVIHAKDLGDFKYQIISVEKQS